MKPFDPAPFINSCGDELVREFGKSGFATSPGLIGDGRESAVRKHLEQLLGGAVVVGTGCVFDSSGSVSQQQDVVVSEAVFGLALSISEHVNYYACETTVSAIEVKSDLNSNSLKDILEKSKSVKILNRKNKRVQAFGSLPAAYPIRKFGSSMHMETTREDEFDPGSNYKDQIFTAAVCGTSHISDEKIAEILSSDPENLSILPNIIISLDGTIISFLKSGKISCAPVGAEAFFYF